jgi:hypothetical protein
VGFLNNHLSFEDIEERGLNTALFFFGKIKNPGGKIAPICLNTLLLKINSLIYFKNTLLVKQDAK